MEAKQQDIDSKRPARKAVVIKASRSPRGVAKEPLVAKMLPRGQRVGDAVRRGLPAKAFGLLEHSLNITQKELGQHLGRVLKTWCIDKSNEFTVVDGHREGPADCCLSRIRADTNRVIFSQGGQNR